jgi:thiosulfate/3-mercaptopyruvate sulfurtransferase
MKLKAASIWKAIVFFMLVTVSKSALSQNPVNWTNDQLIKPLRLAEMIKTNKNVPIIISIGPGALIPGSIAIGSVHEKEHLDSLAKQLEMLNKDAAVVVYCGCCPFEHCPNVRPAIDLLKKMGFTNYKLLDLSQNIKADWIDKGYPSNKL